MPLTIGDRDRRGVVRRLRGLKSVFHRELFLPEANVYQKNTVSQLAALPPLAERPRPKQLADYIACSTILHTADSWSYLARASAGALSGDVDSAMHLGYYSELRSCMAILAAHGVGVFKNRHYLIDASGECQSAGAGNTHEYCWDAFAAWVAADGWSTFSRVVKPSGVPIGAWISAFPSFVAAPAIGANMLQHFGMDIHTLGADKDRRNEVSYRPTAYRGLECASPAIELTCRARAAEALVSTGKFGDCELASAMLASILAESYHQRHGVLPSVNMAGFQAEVAAMVAGAPAPISPTFEADIVRLVTDPPSLLVNALGSLATEVQGFHVEVLARATVLAFLASLTVRELLLDAEISSADIDFWISRLMVERGVYDPPAPNPITDIWTDVENAVRDADALAATNPSQFIMQTRSWDVVGTLCRFERMLVLGLAT